jgi:ankyrin repeat protein
MHPPRRLVVKCLVLGLGLACGLSAAAPAPPNAAQLTTFFRAVQLDDAKTVTAMLGSVVNANQPNPIGGDTGLIQALREDAMAVFKAFLAHPGTNLEAKAANGNTALMMAAFKRNRPAVEALLAKGAKVNQPGWTALHYAAASGDDAIVRLLLARGAQVDAAGPNGKTALMIAAMFNRVGMMRQLIDHGADPRAVDAAGIDSREAAARMGAVEAVDFLNSTLDAP